MMNQKVESNFCSLVEDNDGDTENYATCPLLQLKYTRPRRPIRYVNVLLIIITFLLISRAYLDEVKDLNF